MATTRKTQTSGATISDLVAPDLANNEMMFDKALKILA